MNTIRIDVVEYEIKQLRELLKGYNRMKKELKTMLELKGYEYEQLGTGSSAYTTSTELKVMDIKSRYFLNGKYLVIGCSSRKYGKGNIYQGYVKEIIN